MGASSSAINPTQDFLAKMGGGRLFDMGASAVKYGIIKNWEWPGDEAKSRVYYSISLLYMLTTISS